MSPPQDRIGEVFSVGGIDDEVIRFASGTEGLFDERIVVGHHNDQGRWYGREEFMQRTALVRVIQHFT